MKLFRFTSFGSPSRNVTRDHDSVNPGIACSRTRRRSIEVAHIRESSPPVRKGRGDPYTVVSVERDCCDADNYTIIPTFVVVVRGHDNHKQHNKKIKSAPVFRGAFVISASVRVTRRLSRSSRRPPAEP